MSTTTIAGRDVHVDDEGFLAEYDEWDETLADTLTVTSVDGTASQAIEVTINGADDGIVGLARLAFWRRG